MRYNNTKKRWEPDGFQQRGIVYVDNEHVEFGYFDYGPSNLPIAFDGNLVYIDSIEHCKVPIYWSNSGGYYTFNIKEANNIITDSKHTFYYPIEKCYNFSKLCLNAKKIDLVPDIEFKYLSDFTFGLEYETSAGNIPWLSCVDTNLVPLYDGSIKGHEYVTFPLTHVELPIIRQHLDLLHRYTRNDKNCSLHIHFGGFPITYSKIEALCKYWNYFQYEISKYIPYWSYYVERYKDNGKAYNKPWPAIRSLSAYYEKFTGNDYVDDNSFFRPNMYDEHEERKWEVSGRYFNMNIMHLISGNAHKTVEFRFLRPTTNYSEIKWYLLVLSAFLLYVMKTEDSKYRQITLDKVLTNVYPKGIVSKLKTEGTKLYHLRKVQMSNGDYAGIDKDLKDMYLDLHKFSI